MGFGKEVRMKRKIKYPKCPECGHDLKKEFIPPKYVLTSTGPVCAEPPRIIYYCTFCEWDSFTSQFRELMKK